jgi:probable F420-dependent oxidoreductase
MASFCYEGQMKLGAVFPTNEIGNDPAAIRDWVQAAEDLGYDQVIAYDHVVGAVHADRQPPLWGPYTEADPFHEPFVLFGFMAAVTTKVELVTGIIIAPQRQTVLLAKQAVQVDVLSGGRMVLGLGTGWNPVEYESLGIPFETRGRRLSEQIEVMRRLFREPVVDLTTAEHRVDRAGLLPMPVRDIPIWLGGGSDVSLKRAGFKNCSPRTTVRLRVFPPTPLPTTAPARNRGSPSAMPGQRLAAPTSRYRQWTSSTAGAASAPRMASPHRRNTSARWNRSLPQ